MSKSILLFTSLKSAYFRKSINVYNFFFLSFFWNDLINFIWHWFESHIWYIYPGKRWNWFQLKKCERSIEMGFPRWWWILISTVALDCPFDPDLDAKFNIYASINVQNWVDLETYGNTIFDYHSYRNIEFARLLILNSEL